MQRLRVCSERCSYLGGRVSFDFEVISRAIFSENFARKAGEPSLKVVKGILNSQAEVLAKSLPRDFDYAHFSNPAVCTCFYCERDTFERMDALTNSLFLPWEWQALCCYQCGEGHLESPADDVDARAALLCVSCRQNALAHGVCRWCASVMPAHPPPTPAHFGVPFPRTCIARHDWRQE